METSPDVLLELVHSVMHEYRTRQYRFLRDGTYNITHMDGRVLNYFAAHPGATQSDLAQHSGRDKAQLARLIKGLREQGLLAAEVDETDRRNVHLSLTPEAREIHAALKRQTRRVSKKAVGGLSADQQEQLASLLRVLKANLSAPD
ncbi:MarR family transcriptional regulator [Caballeronia sp. ATUFL_M1_KS5A]|uniref:MarR family winged helix-turn-helix transcriptional regulator n=1 Tax=Caballeronia sp. ATUFL_M1_KS5A TaxID=2921778 RepID=UPI0020283C88|nr:MarR family transcriptional regulator [Caballeronia sp. ATUFL_M1_KS5A]